MARSNAPSANDGKPIGTPMGSMLVDARSKASRKRAELRLGLTFDKPRRPPKNRNRKLAQSEVAMYLAPIMARAEEQAADVREIVKSARAIANNSQKPWNKAARLKKLTQRLEAIPREAMPKPNLCKPVMAGDESRLFMEQNH